MVTIDLLSITVSTKRTSCHNRHCVAGLVTVTNCIESPNEQLQYSCDNRHGACYKEHGSSKTTAFGTLDLTRSDSWCRSSRKLRQLWWGVTVAVEQRNCDHWCNRDCWFSDQSIQTKHHRRQRVTARTHWYDMILNLHLKTDRQAVRLI